MGRNPQYLDPVYLYQRGLGYHYYKRTAQGHWYSAKKEDKGPYSPDLDWRPYGSEWWPFMNVLVETKKLERPQDG